MIEHARRLSAEALQALAGLEQQVVAADGGRLKLEWGTLRTRSGDRVEDLLWWDGGRLVGFLGLYQFGSSVELAGMVAPAARRRGVASALLDAALALCRDRGCPTALLVVPRASAGGAALAQRRGAVLDHSEHALVLRTEPPSGPRDPRLRLRRATPVDVDVVAGLLRAGFGSSPAGLAGLLASPSERTLLIELGDVPVGTLRVSREGEDAGVHGFVVHPGEQGRGVGRDVLRRVCQELRSEGARRVCLEVAVDNDRALGLYTSLGFGRVATEDYYALPPSGSSRGRRDVPA